MKISTIIKKNSRSMCHWCDWQYIYCKRKKNHKCCKYEKGKKKTFEKRELKRELDLMKNNYEYID